MNNEGFCCEHDYESDINGICGCEHENEERLCASRLPESEICEDECVCITPYTRNSYGHCCG